MNWLLYVTVNDISVIYLTAHKCAVRSLMCPSTNATKCLWCGRRTVGPTSFSVRLHIYVPSQVLPGFLFVCAHVV